MVEKQKSAVTVALFACFMGLAATLWGTRPGPTATAFAVAGAPFSVGGNQVQSVVAAGKTVVFDLYEQDGETTARVRLERDTDLTVTVGGIAHHVNVHVIKVAFLYLAIFLFAAIAALIPYALWPATSPAERVGPWYQLLSEPKGGYSLARVQLLIWFLPVAVLYGAFSFLVRSFMPIGTELEILLGLSGATTILGTAASPPADSAPRDNDPTLSDLVTDWNNHGDVSRYQYLLLSGFGAIVLVAAFLSNLEFPVLPTQFLYLIAASQGTYVVTKAVKQSKPAPSVEVASSATSQAPAKAATPTVLHAPSQLQPAAEPVPGLKVPALAELAAADGSFVKPAES